MLKGNCGECHREIGSFAQNEDGSYGVDIIKVPDELGGEYCVPCGTPKQKAYFERLEAKGDHRVEVHEKRLTALGKAAEAKKAKRDERKRRATEKCETCGHTLAICICPPKTPAVVGTLSGEVL